MNIGQQAKSLTNTTKIGNRIGLERKVVNKPKEKDICPRYQPIAKPHYSINRNNRNSATDKQNNSPKFNSNTTTKSKITNQSRPVNNNNRLKTNTIARIQSKTDKTQSPVTKV